MKFDSTDNIDRDSKDLKGMPLVEKIDKLHYDSWAGLAHADRDAPNSYEQLILLLRQMKFGYEDCKEIFRRAIFNILGRN